MKRLSWFFALLVSTFALPLRAADLKPGDAAPEFELQGSDGRTYKLSDFRGKQAVVVAWFPKAFTPGCTKECKSLRENGDAVRAYDVAYFTASIDTPEVNEKFAKSLELDYPILSDPTQATAKAYGVIHFGRPLPERWTFYIGKDGKLLAIDKAIQVDQAAKQVAAKLNELGVPKK